MRQSPCWPCAPLPAPQRALLQSRQSGQGQLKSSSSSRCSRRQQLLLLQLLLLQLQLQRQRMTTACVRAPSSLRACAARQRPCKRPGSAPLAAARAPSPLPLRACLLLPWRSGLRAPPWPTLALISCPRTACRVHLTPLSGLLRGSLVVQAVVLTAAAAAAARAEACRLRAQVLVLVLVVVVQQLLLVLLDLLLLLLLARAAGAQQQWLAPTCPGAFPPPRPLPSLLPRCCPSCTPCRSPA